MPNGQVVFKQVGNQYLTSTVYSLEEFYMIYKRFRIKIRDHVYSDCFFATSRMNYFSVHWNVTVSELSASVQVLSLIHI